MPTRSTNPPIPPGSSSRDGHRSSFADQFTPQLISVLREGYSLAQFRADAIAGLTVAIVALPLSMAIAIASGGTPEQGLYAAIIGGFIISALGGSRFQIGGPAGAFIVLVAGTIMAHGMQGFLLAAMLSGLMLMAAGFLRLGTYIKFIPYPVTVGFTAGIAAIILVSQIVPLLGLRLGVAEPGPFLERLPVLYAALPTVDPLTVLMALGAILVILALKRLAPRVPGMLVVVVLGGLASFAFSLEMATIGSVFGGLSASLPMPSVPSVTLAQLQAVLPNAIAFTLLGAIESLLSAVVADGMSGQQHRSNGELVAQGLANVASALFGGLVVTGTIARTATNVRSGAHGPVAGMLHALFLLAFLLVAAPLAQYIPLAVLAGILVVVAWNMVERQAISILLRASRGDAAVLLVTFALTLFRDLTEAIVVGFALGSALFIQRMARATAVEAHEAEQAAGSGEESGDDQAGAGNRQVLIYRIRGALFFGAAASIGSVLDRIADTHRMLVLDLSSVWLVDSTAANMIEVLVKKARRRGVVVVLSGLAPPVRRDLEKLGIGPHDVRFVASIEEALAIVPADTKAD